MSEIEFPVTFDIKIIRIAALDIKGKEEISEIFNKCKILHKNWRTKASSKGTYNSYTIAVTIDNENQMTLLYERLKELKGIKWAV
jgi:putative lipoic acid-binding regulatory protein